MSCEVIHTCMDEGLQFQFHFQLSSKMKHIHCTIPGAVEARVARWLDDVRELKKPSNPECFRVAW